MVENFVFYTTALVFTSKKLIFGEGIVLALLFIGKGAFAEEIPTATDVQTNLNYVWSLAAAFLVFLMQAGFTRAKNTANIIMKNLLDFSVGSLAYWAIGFGLMFGLTDTGWFGTTGFFFSDYIINPTSTNKI